MESIRRRLSQGLLVLASAMLVVNLLVLLYGVSARYLFNFSPIWMDEGARYLVIGSVMLCAGTVYLDDEHMRVAIMQRFFKGRWGLLVSFYHWLVVLLLSAFITWISARYALSISRFMTPGLGISKSIPLFSLPMGFGALCLLTLLRGPVLHSVPPTES
ncbi:hypothetical protein BTO32_16530 [Marinobacter lutaoensis]|uniref:TRAP transporter small permease protein n=1 Tax=Marinobacter lutaoensis TaxID=135739 RepID=A0A1V2DPG1_9GAMM|nr:hypothetical protein BTO32_16530 [Marinobacter lutaoensis]